MLAKTSEILKGTTFFIFWLQTPVRRMRVTKNFTWEVAPQQEILYLITTKTKVQSSAME